MTHQSSQHPAGSSINLPFLRNAWYVAATSGEIGRQPLGRTICDEPIVLFRQSGGQVVALTDRCPHRKVPLSLGEVIGDEIQCGYHGARFDGAGRCTAIPSQTDLPIPRNFSARRFPAVEAHALVFVWMGEAALADPALIPDWSPNDAPGWTAVHGYHHVKGNYQLVTDNLLDLSHVTYTHKTTLAGEGVNETPMEVGFVGDDVRTSRVMRNVAPAPIHRATRGFSDTDRIDRWQLSDFIAPAFIRVTLGAELAGTTEHLVTPSHIVLNCATPETATTTHYFWSVARSFLLDDEGMSRKFKELTTTAFDEDVVMIEAQQRMIDSDPAQAPLVNFRGDRGGVAARRIMMQKFAAEAQSPIAAK